MGGYGSGRQGWRGVIESRSRLDIRKCRRWLIPGHAGLYRWHRDGEPCGSVSYRVLDRALELSYRVNGDGVDAHAIRITVPIEASHCRYGGVRQYWQCPNCRRRCEVIVLASGGTYWGCRLCLRLRYRCQGLPTSDRLQERADKIWARLGAVDTDWVPKPKWMRWPTFNHLCAKANSLTSEADAWFIAGLRRFGFSNRDDALDKLIGHID